MVLGETHSCLALLKSLHVGSRGRRAAGSRDSCPGALKGADVAAWAARARALFASQSYAGFRCSSFRKFNGIFRQNFCK